jgi:hypothetical protein
MGTWLKNSCNPCRLRTGRSLSAAPYSSSKQEIEDSATSSDRALAAAKWARIRCSPAKNPMATVLSSHEMMIPVIVGHRRLIPTVFHEIGIHESVDPPQPVLIIKAHRLDQHTPSHRTDCHLWPGLTVFLRQTDSLAAAMLEEFGVFGWRRLSLLRYEMYRWLHSKAPL